MSEFMRVTDDVTPRREYTIPRASFDPEAHTEVNKPAVAADGSVLPAKYTPPSMASSGVDVDSYEARTVSALRDEIDERNQGREADQTISRSGTKPALVAALEADDANSESLSSTGQPATNPEEN